MEADTRVLQAGVVGSAVAGRGHAAAAAVAVGTVRMLWTENNNPAETAQHTKVASSSSHREVS